MELHAMIAVIETGDRGRRARRTRMQATNTGAVARRSPRLAREGPGYRPGQSELKNATHACPAKIEGDKATVQTAASPESGDQKESLADL
jgi:hypothetical protein